MLHLLVLERKARPAAFQKSKLGYELIELGISPKRKIVDSKAAGKFDQIAGRDGAKESLRTAIGNLERQRKNAMFYRHTPINGILLFGPKGDQKVLTEHGQAKFS